MLHLNVLHKNNSNLDLEFSVCFKCCICFIINCFKMPLLDNTFISASNAKSEYFHSVSQSDNIRTDFSIFTQYHLFGSTINSARLQCHNL